MSAEPTLLERPAGVHVLHPGDVVIAERGERMETLLGSCIAIVLTDPRRTVGVMCHIVNASACPPGRTCGTSYAEPALDAMFALLQGRGIAPRWCEAYVAGGGNMFPSLFGSAHVGDRNARWALDALAQHGIRLLAEDLGGTSYRRLAWTVGAEAPQIVAVPV
jgi:chemotaxis protein CheD